MPSATKSTFSLDANSIKNLNRLAKDWRTSKTEVVRRALQEVAERHSQPTVQEKLAALRQFQENLKDVDFNEWQRVMKDGRR